MTGEQERAIAEQLSTFDPKFVALAGEAMTRLEDLVAAFRVFTIRPHVDSLAAVRELSLPAHEAIIAFGGAVAEDLVQRAALLGVGPDGGRIGHS